MMLIGPAKNNQTIDLNGATVDYITVKSTPEAQAKNITIANGTARRILVQGPDSWDDLVPKSFEKNYLDYLKETAPIDITISQMRLSPYGDDNGALYTYPGVSNLTLVDSVLTGTSTIALYLNSECRGTTVARNQFKTDCEREHIAVDGAYLTTIVTNTFTDRNGSIHFYRNCGEGGRNRWNQPTNNVVKHNTFIKLNGSSPAIDMNSRIGKRCYCFYDARGIIGSSSRDWRSAPYDNTVDSNIFAGYKKAIKASQYHNTFSNNVDNGREPILVKYDWCDSVSDWVDMNFWPIKCVFG